MSHPRPAGRSLVYFRISCWNFSNSQLRQPLQGLIIPKYFLCCNHWRGLPEPGCHTVVTHQSLSCLSWCFWNSWSQTVSLRRMVKGYLHCRLRQGMPENQKLVSADTDWGPSVQISATQRTNGWRASGSLG